MSLAVSFQLSHGAGPQCPQGAAQSETNAFTKGAICGLAHHKYCAPRKTKGTHNTLKEHPIYLLQNERPVLLQKAGAKPSAWKEMKVMSIATC